LTQLKERLPGVFSAQLRGKWAGLFLQAAFEGNTATSNELEGLYLAVSSSSFVLHLSSSGIFSVSVCLIMMPLAFTWHSTNFPISPSTRLPRGCLTWDRRVQPTMDKVHFAASCIIIKEKGHSSWSHETVLATTDRVYRHLAARCLSISQMKCHENVKISVRGVSRLLQFPF